MESSLNRFIWKYSKRQQLIVVALTLVVVPDTLHDAGVAEMDHQ